MEVRLTGWRSKNIRGGLRDLDIDLGSDPRRWTLVQMSNGTGKTTTMDLLRSTLTGRALSTPEVRAFRADDLVETGLFEARLVVDDRPIRLQMELDFRDGSVSYWTVRAETRGGGREEGRAVPSELRELLKPALTELFVFNGELATQILDLSKSRAAGAIRALYGLDQVDALQERVTGLVQQEVRRAASVTSAKEQKGITQLQNLVNEATSAKQRLEQLQQASAARLAEVSRERERLDAEITARLSEDAGVRAEIEALDVNQVEVDANANDLSTQALEAFRRPPHVSDLLQERLKTLGEQLYTLKLPETISREFFNELANEKLCVCGRPIGHTERDQIITGAGRYLAQDQITVINQMKTALRDSSGAPNVLGATIASLQAQLVERRKIKAERDRLASERIAEGDDVLAKLRADLGECIEEVNALSATLERLSTKDSIRQRALRVGWESNLPLCDGELEVRKFRLQTATKTRDFSEQGKRLNQIIADTTRRALDGLRDRVRLATNEKLKLIIKGEDLQVSKIGGGLELQSGGLDAKAGASEGQKLAIAYAFLTSLLAEAPYKLPFIVDSPAVSLDTEVRREVGELIPSFFGQMVMLVISSEREGFADAFYGRAPEDVRFLTVAAEGGGQVRIEEGLQAFRDFHGKDLTA